MIENPVSIVLQAATGVYARFVESFKMSKITAEMGLGDVKISQTEQGFVN